MAKYTTTILRIVMALPAILFIVMGLRWLLDPAGIAPELGLALHDGGVGLSSQIGDMSGYFLMTGLCVLTGLVTKKRYWFYAPIILLSLTALGRILAWLIHHADYAGDLIMPEVIISLLWFFGSKKVCDTKD